ncbi:MAG: hypothetical protein JW783_15945 [Bacteroidales bacterium]|nr:hypothetical protein [Bacteroidales bacterium]MBN2750630.1 hypothetical protein [Bacteroidales bacterium]
MIRLMFKPLLLIIAAIGIASCTDTTTETITYNANVPVYMSYNEFRSSFKVSEPQEMVTPGKIYFKDNYLFVNEREKGIHVIDNSNPASPIKIAFYNIIGNVDMAIKGDKLFADSFIDLVVFDISDVQNPIEIGRVENVFPEVVPIGDFYFPCVQVDKAKGIVVDWETKSITDEYTVNYTPWWRDELDFTVVTANGALSGGTGIAGSMARFMLSENHLYTIATPYSLETFEISTPSTPVRVDSIGTSRFMETLFKHQSHLFVGTNNGLLIYSIGTASKPELVSEYNHVTACDPVVVDGQYAYVTLRSGNQCNNAANVLEVIDISSITTPFLVKQYPMFNPHGLGIDEDLLFICDGDAGLKVYNREDPLAIIQNQLAHFTNINTFDVIPYNGVLMLIGTGGIYQYDYSNPQDIKLLSTIPISTQKK